jgi:hypothetical protein
MFHRHARPPAPNDAPPAPSGGGSPPVPVAPPPNPPVAPPPRPAATTHHEPGRPGPSGLTPPERDEVGSARAALREIEERARAAEERANAAIARARSAEHDAAMAAEVSHPDVRRHFRRAYDDYEAETKAGGQSPVAFDAWFRSEHVRQSPLHSNLLPRPAAAAPAAPAAGAAPPPPVAPPARVEGGERNGGQAPAPTTLTPEQIAAAARDPRQWSQLREQAIADAEARFGQRLTGRNRRK